MRLQTYSVLDIASAHYKTCVCLHNIEKMDANQQWCQMAYMVMR